MKKILLSFTILLTVGLLFGCMDSDPLKAFENSVTTDIKEIDSFEVIEDHNDVESLSIQLSVLSQTTLLEDEMTDQEKIMYARQLFHDIQLIHAQNIISKDTLSQNWQLLKSDIALFREQELNLNDEDKETILSYRAQLIAERELILLDRGKVRELFNELRGQYKLETIDLVISNFEEIKTILEERQAFISLVDDTVIQVNEIVKTYL